MTFAVGADYLDMARLQAMSIKLTQKQVKNFAVVVDQVALKCIRLEDNDIFDRIIPLDYSGNGWDMTQEYRALSLSPWRHTIKTDADIVFPSSIDHWWQSLKHRDVALSTMVYDFREQLVTSRQHRRLFDENHLPNVYSAVSYFRYSNTANRFFNIVQQVTADWDWFAKDYLIKNDDMRPRTDEIFAIASQIIGTETVTWPCSTPSFVHMKESINGLSNSAYWYTQIHSYWSNAKLFVGNHAQRLPFHYHQKGWINEGTYTRVNRDYKELSQGHD